MSRIIATQDYGPKRFKWLTLKLIEWQDPAGKQRFWESCERTTRAASGVDAVAIVAKATSRYGPPQIVLVSQYRPPLDSICIELPAGLVDEGEMPELAASRELREETGFAAHEFISSTPICCSDPGMSNTNTALVVVEVDLDARLNKKAQQKLDDGEHIEVILAPWGKDLVPWLKQRKADTNCEIDARLMSFAVGLGLSTENSDRGGRWGFTAARAPSSVISDGED
jgi:ADP-ribose pyrophosphatase